MAWKALSNVSQSSESMALRTTASSSLMNLSMFSAYLGRRKAPFSMRLTASLSWKAARGRLRALPA